jgi:uncharacterized protein (DUF4415 family)
MSEKFTPSASALGNPGRTDFNRLQDLTDEEIDAAIASDTDAAPALDETWAAGAAISVGKATITIRLDKDVLAFFKDGGRFYQSRINDVLRAYMQEQR